MGNSSSRQKKFEEEFEDFAHAYVKLNKDKEYMIIERVIQAKVPVYIGICGKDTRDNPLAHQCIRIGNKNPQSLISFDGNNGTLKYEFEGKTSLEFRKMDNKVLYHIMVDHHSDHYIMDETMRKTFKTISMNSRELDKIHEFIKAI